MANETKKTTVVVARRQDYAGYYAAGEFWPAGVTPVEVVADKDAKEKAQRAEPGKRFVTEAQHKELAEETTGFLTLGGGDGAALAADALTDEERALVEEFRKKKAAEAAKAQDAKAKAEQSKK
ncbi:hypothetical protein [Myxococcus phage Mx4 ts27htf-1hrm-1]|nr:hypothetical protein Mx4_p51 [Myxococcus phage Mx4]WNM70390.1 hypothetical protein [Myxococcus phage Mx4 ts27htf-1hrm-1]